MQVTKFRRIINMMSMIFLLGILSMVLGCPYQMPEFNNPFETGKTSTIDTDKNGFKIISGNLSIVSNELIGRISLTAIPDQLSYNQSRVTINDLEYEISIKIDVEGNGIYEYEMGLYHFKNSENKFTGDLISNIQKTLWKVTSGGGTNIYNISAYISGNAVTLSCPVSSDPGLSLFNANSKYTIATYYNDGIELFSDNMNY